MLCVHWQHERSIGFYQARSLSSVRKRIFMMPLTELTKYPLYGQSLYIFDKYEKSFVFRIFHVYF